MTWRASTEIRHRSRPSCTLTVEAFGRNFAFRASARSTPPPPHGPAAPSWIGLDRDTYHARLAERRRWADTVLRQHYGGYELRDCWPGHIHAVWELSTLAAEWHHAYSGTRPDLARALEFHDRWLPGTIRRITGITGRCMPHCVMLRGPRDWAARPGYRCYLRRAGRRAGGQG
jgi:hypothetical protein